MSMHKYGLLLSQLLDCISRPLEEDQVWALCYELCQSILCRPQNLVNPCEEMALRCWEVETIYLRRDGRVMFISDNHSPKCPEQESQECLLKQMKDLSVVLTTCLENGGPKEFLRRQVGSDLELLTRNLSDGVFTQNGSGWLDVVADCCVQHASVQSEIIPKLYYRGICELMAQEAIEMNNFLAVLSGEITQCNSERDAFSTFQLTQARPVISNWLQCMSEIRDDTIQEHQIEVQRSLVTIESCNKKRNISRFPGMCPTPSRSKITLPKIDELVESPEAYIQLPKPSYHSTPTVIGDRTRKVLRPPERLVNQVTTWILEGEPKDSSNLYDVSWLPEQQPSHTTSSLGWFEEAKRIRRVLTELQIDTAMGDDALYKALKNEEICFCCQANKFKLFHRSCMNCEVCERKICSSCITRTTVQDIPVNRHDSTIGSRDSGVNSRDFENCSQEEADSEDSSIFGQIRKAFKSKPSGGESLCNMCQDCKNFIQSYF